MLDVNNREVLQSKVDMSNNTRVDSNGNFITDDNGRDRQATPQEIDKTLQDWEDKGSGKKTKGK